MYLVNAMSVILQARCQLQRTFFCLRYVNCGPGHVDCIYSSAYSDFNIQMKVGPLLLEVSPQCNERYTASLVSNTAHIVQFTLCGLWSRIIQSIYSSVYLCFNIQLQVSAAAIVDITTVQCALYCKLSAKYSAHPPVYAM
jgi:hypothetical protein